MKAAPTPAEPIELPDALCTSVLVAMLYENEEKAAELAKEREDLEARLIARGEGKYVDQKQRRANVVFPSPSKTLTLYSPLALAKLCESLEQEKPTPETLRSFRRAREDQAKAIAGNSFLDLFQFESQYKPIGGFEHRVDALLTPARAKSLLTFCTFVAPAAKKHVKLLDKPKAK